MLFLARVREKRSHVNYVMAELMGDVRELLQNILSDPFLFENFIPKRSHGNVYIFFLFEKVAKFAQFLTKTVSKFPLQLPKISRKSF